MLATATQSRQATGEAEATALIEYEFDGSLESSTVPAVYVDRSIRQLVMAGALILAVGYRLADGSKLEILPVCYERGYPKRGVVQRVESTDRHWSAAIQQLIRTAEEVPVVLTMPA